MFFIEGADAALMIALKCANALLAKLEMCSFLPFQDWKVHAELDWHLLDTEHSRYKPTKSCKSMSYHRSFPAAVVKATVCNSTFSIFSTTLVAKYRTPRCVTVSSRVVDVTAESGIDQCRDVVG